MGLPVGKTLSKESESIFESSARISHTSSCKRGFSALNVNKCMFNIGDIRKLLYEKRRRCMMDTRASVKNINQKIERVWKTQEEQRQKLYHEYCQQFLTLLQEWDIDVQKAKEEEEKLANIFRQQQNVLQHSRTVQSQRMQAIKGLYEQFLKSVEDLEKNRENFLTGEQSELRKEMAMLQKHLMMEH
ncbi:hypothetical protein GH733_019680, partial [Mirounga leonina]